MNVNVQDIAVTELVVATCFDPATGDFLFSLDELKNMTISQTQDKQDITGKQGRKLNSLKRNKAITISGVSGLVSGGLMELQTGGKFETKVTTVLWTDYLEIDGDMAETSYIAVGNMVGKEIDELYIKNKNGTLGEKLEQIPAGIPTATQFLYDPSTKILEFAASEYPDGTEFVAYYKRKISASVLENLSDSYSGKAEMYIDAIGEDSCSNVYRIQFYIPRADFNGNFDLALGDNQTDHNWEAESLSGACGKSGRYFTYTVFGANAEDVA